MCRLLLLLLGSLAIGCATTTGGETDKLNANEDSLEREYRQLALKNICPAGERIGRIGEQTEHAFGFGEQSEVVGPLRQRGSLRRSHDRYPCSGRTGRAR